MKHRLFTEAVKIANTFDVSTPKDGAVLYSISYQPTNENKKRAYEFVKNSKGTKLSLDHTDCGAKLIEMGLESDDCGLAKDEQTDIWAMASKRFIKSASGDITVFVDNADDRSVFKTIELPNILANSKIKTINKINKKNFVITNK